MTDRTTLDRALPMLEILPPPAVADPRRPAAPDDERLAEYLPETRALPRFHMWTLGCQMNRSDSEEMAGRLLQAGCAEATGFDDADLIVINSCAIREGAEQKIIGRQGQLGKLKAEHPGLRVVLTGCAVREPERDGLRRRYPAVDLFLRPDEEPELVDRLGLASAQAPIGAVGGTTVVHRTTVGVADGLSATRATAVEAGTVARGSAISAWLPIIYGCDKTCTYCIVPFSRGPERSRPFDEIVDEARSLAAAGYHEVTLLGQNVNSYGHDLAPEARFGHVDEARWAGHRLDLHGRPDLAELLRAIDGLRTADGRPAIGRLRFVTSHPWDLSDRLIAALADCASICEHLHLPVQSGDDTVLRRMGRQYTIEHYQERLSRIREAVPGHRGLDRRHRRVLRRDRGAVPVHAAAARGGPLRPGLRGRVLAAARDARDAARPTTCRPRRSGAGSTSCSRSRRGSASSATGRGSAATSRCWSRRSASRAPTSTRRARRPGTASRAGPAATSSSISRVPPSSSAGS